MPFKMGFISLSELENIPPEILKMLDLLGTCNIPTFLMSSAPKEAIRHLREKNIEQLFESTILGVDDQMEIILDKLSRAKKPPLRRHVYYLSNQSADIEAAIKIGISAFHFDENSAQLITSHLRVNM